MQKQPSEQEILLTIEISKSIANLEKSPSWQQFTKAAESLIEQAMPNVSSFDSADATKIASKMAYIQGIKDTLAIVKMQKKKLPDLEKNLASARSFVGKAVNKFI